MKRSSLLATLCCSLILALVGCTDVPAAQPVPTAQQRSVTSSQAITKSQVLTQTGQPASPVTTAKPAATASPSATTGSRLAQAVLPLMERFTPMPGDIVTQVTPGVVHVRRETDDPLQINLLLFDMTSPKFAVRTAIGQNWLIGRYRTSQMAQENGAIAAVNGDLFSETGVPQGLTIIDSNVVTAPKHRATFAWSTTGQPFIGYFTDQWTWDASVTAADGAKSGVAQLNTSCSINLVCLYNDFARVVPQRTGDIKVILDAQNQVTKIVRESQVRVITDTQVLQATGTGVQWVVKHIAVGDTLNFAFNTMPLLSNYRQAISGGPIILRDGQYTEDCLCALRDCKGVVPAERGPLCEDFTTDWKQRHYRSVRMPRTGIGYDAAKQTLIVAVVDGYQRGYSRGVTQEEFASLLQEFGASTAMEFDGGGSATMVLKDRIVNRPPDASGERYVSNALLFFWDGLFIDPNPPTPVPRTRPITTPTATGKKRTPTVTPTAEVLEPPTPTADIQPTP